MYSNSGASRRTKPKRIATLSTSLLKMARNSTERKVKLRKLGRKLRAQFRIRPVSSAFSTAQHDLRTVKSVMSLRSSRNLIIHHVPTSAIQTPSFRRQSVRFSHPAVRRVISALPTPLTTAGRTIPDPVTIQDSPATVDFPGQVNASTIYQRRSHVTNTVLFEDIFSKLDGVPAGSHNSALLRRREERRRTRYQHSSAVVPNIESQANDQPWPKEGICGTLPLETRTKSGLRALQYLSFHPPIREEAFSDEEIFKTSDTEQDREQHLQATLDQLSIPRGEEKSATKLSHPPSLQPSRALERPAERVLPALPAYEAFDASRHSKMSINPQPATATRTASETANVSKAQGKKPASLRVQQNIQWETALRALQQRDLASGDMPSTKQAMPHSVSRPMNTISVDEERPDIAISDTPDFPTPKPNDLKRRTLLQSTALDLNLSTPARLDSAITPCFPVLDHERELRRRTIIGEQQRDLFLTPATAVPAGQPARTFSIPRRGVGQPAKQQAVSGLPYLPLLPVIEVSSSPFPSFAASPAGTGAQSETITGWRQASSSSETVTKPKVSRMALLKKIVTKTY